MRRAGKVMTGLMACVLAGSCLAGCGDNHGGKTVIKFWGSASEEEAEALNAVVSTYNETNTDNIWLDYQPQPDGGYADKISRVLSGAGGGPDIFYVSERNFKLWAQLGYLENLQSRIDEAEIDLDGMWYSSVQRYRYNPAKNTNNADDDLYCVPKDISPTAVYYNKTMLENQGIVVISVDEDKIDAFNNGAPDNVGKTKSDYGISGTVLKKGFYRERPFDGYNWTKPVYGTNGKVAETMIFNNRIAMSWDEIEDLAMILTKEANDKLNDPTGQMQWGYFTEWWFNYGWGVGGDCAVDTTGEGDWVFTLGDTTKKCVLYNEDGSYAYNASHQVIFVEENKTSTYNKESGQYFGNPLPSQREALDRFVGISRTDNNRGVAIAPTPQQIGTKEPLSFFTQGKVAMLVNQNYLINSMRKMIGNRFEWDVCPLPVYKEYEDIYGDDVKTQGINIGHSGSTGFGIWTNSNHKDEAFKVITYLTGAESQTIMSNAGFTMCNQRDIAQKEYVEAQVEKGLSPRNIQVFVEYGDVQRPADWWYMPDDAWIDEWATLLNKEVRNGDMTVDRLFELKTDSTNELLKKFKQNAAN